MNSTDLTVVQRAVLNRLPTLGLPRGARILDAPCGGAAALTLALRERGFDAVGADIDAEAATRLGLHFQEANLDAGLPWPAESFDAVHGGGQRWAKDSPEYDTILHWIEESKSPK